LARSTALKKRAFLPVLIMLLARPMAMWLLPVPGPADQDYVVLILEEGTLGELLDQLAVDRRVVEGELGKFFDERQFGNSQLVVDGSRLLGGDLGFEQGMDHPLHALLTLDAHRDDLVVDVPHAR
jgi:hypothetical protein